jgi:hypothetical protein
MKVVMHFINRADALDWEKPAILANPGPWNNENFLK